MPAPLNDLPKPREAVGKFEPYLPGRSLAEVKREHKLTHAVKLASNESPWGPSPRAVRAAREAVSRSYFYPDSFSAELRTVLAKKAGLPVAQIVLGSGSDELIELLGRAYLSSEDAIVVSRHAFSRYKMAADLMDAETIEVPMAPGLRHDLKAMARAVTPKTKLIFVVNPNNPTGTYNTGAELLSFLDALPPHVLPVLDEAYFDYARLEADYPSGVEWLKAGRRLMVLRTFSKAYGMAGFRLGWGAGPVDVVDALERIRPPFNLTVPTQAAGVAAVEDAAFVRRVAREARSERKKLERALTARGVRWTPSAANFLLIDVSPLRGSFVFEKLLRQGVIVRSLDEYGLHEYIRVSVGRPAENRFFLKAFDETRGTKKP